MSVTLWDEEESRDIFNDQICVKFLTVSLAKDHLVICSESPSICCGSRQPIWEGAVTNGKKLFPLL